MQKITLTQSAPPHDSGARQLALEEIEEVEIGVGARTIVHLFDPDFHTLSHCSVNNFPLL